MLKEMQGWLKNHRESKVLYKILLISVLVGGFAVHFNLFRIINVFYYMALACGRYNACSDWLIVTEL